MNTAHQSLRLNADQPIKRLKDDLLRRGPFAINLANAITSWSGDESLVVALYGPWGSGKSSVKNFVIEMVRKGDDPLVVVDFNPWNWSGQDRLTNAFFSEIGIAIGHRAIGRAAKEVASSWQRYANGLARAAPVVRFAKTAGQWMGVPGAPLLEPIAKSLEAGSKALGTTAKVLETDEVEEPLEDLKKSLSASLAKLKKPLLVVIDDVDRLTREEIRTLFQLVKANGDFPNMIFFVLFDRIVVEAALNSESGSTGRKYLEKIVQAGFDLPEVTIADLDSAFMAGLERVLLQYPNANFDPDGYRLTLLYERGLRPFIQTMRDVRRFLSSLSFTIGLFYINNTLEVCMTDILGIEALRVFEPDIYRLLPESQEILIPDEFPRKYGGDKDEDLRKQQFERIIEATEPRNRERVRTLIGELFPFAESGFTYSSEDEWLRELRVCSRQVFPRYFVFGVPIDDIPKKLIDEAIERSSNVKSIRKLLSSLRDDDRIGIFVSRLIAHVPVVGLDIAENFIVALWDIGDKLSDHQTGPFGLNNPVANAGFLIRRWLLQEKAVDVRERVLLSALSRSDGVLLPALLISSERLSSESDFKADRSLLSDSALMEARKSCILKLEQFAAKGALVGRWLGTYLWRWYHLGDPAGARRYAMSLASSESGALEVLRALASESRISAGGGPAFKHTTVKLSNLEIFVDVPAFEKVLQKFLREPVPKNKLKLEKRYAVELKALRRALKRRVEGKPDVDNDLDDI